MGTRGVIGWRKDETDKLAYNHFDSYPEELGVAMLKYASKPLEALKEDFDAVEMIDTESKPTKEQIERCWEHESVNLSVSDEADTDWYCLLRDVQGRLQETADVGYMIDYSAFMSDSLFCEWAYLVNLDSEKLECYRGFQEDKAPPGRYGQITQKSIDHQEAGAYKGSHIYYGVGLIKEYDLANLPTADTLVKELNELTRRDDD